MTNRIGEVLKEARSKRSITLDDVHAKIKIHPRVLQLLEEGKFEKLPSPLFTKSFLRSYAEFLEVNPDELLQQYDKEGVKEPEQVLFIRTADERMQKPIGQEMLNITLIVLGLVVGGGFGFFVLKNAPHWFANAKAPSFALPAKNFRPAKAEALRAKEAEVVASQKKKEDWLRSPDQGNFPRIGGNSPIELKIKAVDSVWLRITGDGKILYQTIMKKGQEESWSAKKSVEIWTGNSSNMALTVNKTFLGSPGKGVIKKMVISREGVRVLS